MNSRSHPSIRHGAGAQAEPSTPRARPVTSHHLWGCHPLTHLKPQSSPKSHLSPSLLTFVWPSPDSLLSPCRPFPSTTTPHIQSPTFQGSSHVSPSRWSRPRPKHHDPHLASGLTWVALPHPLLCSQLCGQRDPIKMYVRPHDAPQRPHLTRGKEPIPTRWTPATRPLSLATWPVQHDFQVYFISDNLH